MFGKMDLIALLGGVFFPQNSVAARQGYVIPKTQLEVLFGDLSHHISGNAPPILTIILGNLRRYMASELCWSNMDTR